MQISLHSECPSLKRKLVDFKSTLKKGQKIHNLNPTRDKSSNKISKVTNPYMQLMSYHTEPDYQKCFTNPKFRYKLHYGRTHQPRSITHNHLQRNPKLKCPVPITQSYIPISEPETSIKVPKKSENHIGSS